MGTRRGHGEGSISRRNDGPWMGRVDLGYVNGKRKRKYIYGKTRKEVAEQLNKLLAQQGQGYNIAPERQTVAKFLERWLADVIAQTVRPSTHTQYTLGVNKHINPRIGHVPLAKLTPQQV